jgi:hypothetical protein
MAAHRRLVDGGGETAGATPWKTPAMPGQVMAENPPAGPSCASTTMFSPRAGKGQSITRRSTGPSAEGQTPLVQPHSKQTFRLTTPGMPNSAAICAISGQ